MKKIIAFLLCTALLLSLLGCEKKSTEGTGENHLWDEAAPEMGVMKFCSFDKNGGQCLSTFSDDTKNAVLNRLSAVTAQPVNDWTANKVKLPVYGITIPTDDGWGIHAAWSNGYLILRDGSVYKFDFDFSALAKDYQWPNEKHTINSLAGMPCGRLLSEGPDGWIAKHLSPADQLTAPEGIAMTLKEQTDEDITVELTNHSGTEWFFGEYFSLQVLLNDAWYNVPVLSDRNYGFHDIAWLLSAGKTQAKTYNLSMYGDLPAGTYRLVVENMSVEFLVPKA